MKHVPELVVMLTHNDKTVPNAIEVFESAKDAPAVQWGFKEVGLPTDQMKELVKLMKAAGKTVSLEVVAYTEEECIKAAELGVECDFDLLMGTLYFDSVHRIAKEGGMQYWPFVGKIHGRPSVLEGTIEEIIEEANMLADKGVDGVDLLAYRYASGDPEELAARFVASVKIPVCLAGSIKNYARLDKMLEIGPWGYTIGGAFFEKAFGDVSFADQIKAVQDYMHK